MELMVDTMQNKTASNKKGPGQNRLKNFNIPKRTLDKVILTECFADKREYDEVKQCLIQGCLATEDNFENLWSIEKIEMVQNKHLEEEFVMKRSSLRQERKPDKERPCFLVVSKDDVSKICQSGLHTGQQLKMMNEIGNRHLGVYLFRHVDIALKYAASCSSPVENVIIFRVLLGKVKKIPPAKGKKKIALDPAPNFDCHMSTVHPSVKDLLENQALGSLVYLYEYNELAKPVDRPRQCLPYAVVKLKCVNLRKCAGFTLTSLKGRPKGLPKRVERDLPLENCTRVTRIGKSQLIYEHFRKPIESCTPEMNASIDIRNCHIDKEKLLEIHKGVSPDSGLSIVTTSKSIKDPRLARRQQILEKQNGEAASHESLTYEKKLDCNLEMQMSAALGIPYILPATSLLFDSSLVSGQRQCMEKTTWKECTPEECLPSPLLNHEQWLGNIEKEILGWQNTYTSLAMETYLDNHYFKSIDSQHSLTVMGGNLQEQKEMQYSELFSSQLNPYQTVGNVWIPQDFQPSSKEHECIIEPFFNFYDNDQYMYRKNPENITSGNNETDGREEVRSWLCDSNEDNDDDNYTSEKHCSAALDAKYFMNSCTLSEGEHSIKFCNLQDNTLQSGKIPFSENALKDVCTEDQYIFERSVVEMSTEYLEQNELEAVKQSEKSGILEVHNKIEQIDSVSETTKPTVAEKKEHIVKELKENSVEERIDNTDFTGFSNANPEMFDTGIFGRENIPEICEQALEIKYRDVQDFKIICEMDDALKGHKKCLSGPLKLCDHKNLADEEGIYDYLQKRMDWDSANTEVPGNPSGNENVNEHLPREKPVLEDMETDSFNTFVYPDLEITVTTLFQSESKKEVGKRASKYSGLKKSIKSLQGKTLEKCTEVQKNCKPCHTKEECSTATFSSLSKGQFKKTVQSEKRIKNTFNTHNREVLLCKNRRLSKKIGGALFHLRKARRRVQSLKIGAKTRKKKSNISLSHINKMVYNGSLPSGFFAASDCLSDMPCRSDSVTNTAIREAEVVSDTPTPNKASSNSLSNESTLSDEQNSVNFTSSNIVEDTNQNLSFENNLCATQNTANHLNLSVVGNELVSHEDKNKVEVISNRNMDIVSLATTSHTALESSAKEDVFKPGDTSKLSPNFLMLENVGDEKRIMEMCPVEENEYTSIIAERYFLLPAKQKHDVQLTPQIHDVGLVHLNTRSNDSSNKILEKSSERLVVESFTGQEQEANFHMENIFLKPEDSCPSELSRKAEWEFCAAEYNRCRKSDIMTKSVNQPENNFEVVCPSGYLESPVSLEDNKLSHSSSNYAFQGCEDVGKAFLKTKEHFSDPKQCVINDILVKPLMNMSLDQKHLPHTTYSTSCQETTCGQPSTSLLARTFSEEHVESITATSPSASAYYDVITTKTKQMFTSSMTRPNENYISVGLPNSNTDLGSDYTCEQIKTELTSNDFQIKIPEILRKADETSSLALLHEQIMFCKRILPVFIEAFQKKQGCSFEHVLVSREILGSAGGSLQPSCKLDPCAIESLVELQIVMETIEFIENKKKLLEREPTFRSLLWYDNSLCSELFGGQTGTQQQSNFYPAFQRRLKYSPLNELESYHKQLVDVFENTRWENNSYYTFLKSRREIEECEAAMETNSDYSDFFLSVPYVCGANYGDTLDDLEATRKNTMQLISVYKDLPGIHLSAEKDFHLWLIMDITTTKLEFIRTCEGVNIKSSLFGLEHIFFDAAKSLVWKEKFINGNLKDGQMLNIVDLPKFYQTYENMIQQITEQAVQQTYVHEKKAGQQNANNCIVNSLILPNICFIGEILDEAQSADIERLEQLMCRCTGHMEMLQKYFQILQEENISVLITKENVLGFMKSDGIKPVILKPEAIEIYIELAMVYETVVYLQNSIAQKVNKPRFRSLLWIDLSLLPEFFQGQEKMASFSYRKGNILELIESSISEIEEELNVIYDYSGNLNCPYAVHLFTRELTELSKTKNLLRKSKPSIARCVDLAPYSISLNYGSTVYELECNFNQFSSLLEKLMLAERKDLGKIAHIMKIMKTIEHMKFVCSEQGKSPLPVVIHQMLKNWRKAFQFKRLDTKTNLTDGEGKSTKHNFQHSQAWNERPANVTLESNLCSPEENNGFPQSKKKKKH